jgi:hypothetical protein
LELNEIVDRLTYSFKDEQLKKDILTAEYYLLNKETGIHSVGFCYTASEVIFRLTGEYKRWKPMLISGKLWKHGNHYYLIDKQDNSIMDLTADQFTERGITLPYELGKFKPFRNTSNRAKLLMEHIMN